MSYPVEARQKTRAIVKPAHNAMVSSVLICFLLIVLVTLS